MPAALQHTLLLTTLRVAAYKWGTFLSCSWLSITQLSYLAFVVVTHREFQWATDGKYCGMWFWEDTKKARHFVFQHSGGGPGQEPLCPPTTEERTWLLLDNKQNSGTTQSCRASLYTTSRCCMTSRHTVSPRWAAALMELWKPQHRKPCSLLPRSPSTMVEEREDWQSPSRPRSQAASQSLCCPDSTHCSSLS
jgi:hypothetical protein